MIGTVSNERYRIDVELGRGGMGVVYRARDTLLDRDVAVKVLSDSRLGTEGRARLLHEAQAAAKLNHPNIVSVHDAGEYSPSGARSRLDPSSFWNWRRVIRYIAGDHRISMRYYRLPGNWVRRWTTRTPTA
jgi:serine/threonine protein kinase